VATLLRDPGCFDAVSLRDVGPFPNHSHPHPHTLLPNRQGWQGYLVGLIHGLAGSGALLILVAATLPSTTLSILYALVFGIGSIIGMGLVTTLLASPLLALKKRPLFYNTLTGLSGVLSMALGIHILWTFAH